MAKNNFDWSVYIAKNSSCDVDFLYKRGVQYPKMILQTLRSQIKKRDVKSIIELGCSAGFYALLIEKMLNKKVNKTGIDINPEILNYDLLDKYICKDIIKWNTKKHNKKYDIVFSLGLVEHFSPKDREKLFKDHVNLSNKYIVIGCPNVSFSLRYIIIKIFDDFFKSNYHYKIGQKEIEAFAKKNKLKILTIDYIGNNSLLQKMFRFKSELKLNFFKDYFLVILEK